MQGHVFLTRPEGGSPKKFREAIEMLQQYIAKKISFPADLYSLTQPEFKVTPVAPPEHDPKATDVPSLPDKPTAAQRAAYGAEMHEHTLAAHKAKVLAKSWGKRLEEQPENLATVYAVIWGQCSPSMQAKIKLHKNYNSKQADRNCTFLLTAIKHIINDYNVSKHPVLSADDAKSKFFSFKQHDNMSLPEYHSSFIDKKDTVIALDGFGSLRGDPANYPKKDADGNSFPTIAAQEKAALDLGLAMAFIKRSNDKTYGELKSHLHNQYLAGSNQYPLNLDAAHSRLSYFVPTPSAQAQSRRQPTTSPHTPSAPASGLQFAQTDDELVPGTNGRVIAHITCHCCNLRGHFATACPDRTPSRAERDAGFTLLQLSSPSDPESFGITLTVGTTTIPDSWVLLDSESTTSVFNNSRLLQNIRQHDHAIRVFTNGGEQVSSLVGDLPNFGAVWYNPDSIANILSLAAVRKSGRPIQYDCDRASFFVQRADHSWMEFVESPSGLYYFDTGVSCDTSVTNFNSSTVANYSLVSTVSSNLKQFSRREIEGATAARELYRKINRPSQAQFESILRRNLIRNCPVTVDDAKRATIIWGPDVAALKGKSTKEKTEHVPSFQAIPIPAPILDKHQALTVCVDFLYVQGQIFFHTITRKLKLRTIAPVSSRGYNVILREVRAAMSLYQKRGFLIPDIHADMEFECIQNQMLPTVVNLVAQDAHVPEIERANRTLKERVRATIHGLPYKAWPILMVRSVVVHCNSWLNAFPPKEGISDTMSPTTIMTGKPSPDYNRIKIEFGAYAQVQEDNNPTNDTRPRMIGCIALNPSGNAQGDYYFMSLETGKRLSRHKWTELPITQEVINRVELIAAEQGQPKINADGLLFEWRPKNPILDETIHDFVDPNEDDDEEFVPEPDLPHDHTLPTAQFENESQSHVDQLDDLGVPIADADEGAHDSDEGARDADEGAHDSDEGAHDFNEGGAHDADDSDEGAPDGEDSHGSTLAPIPEEEEEEEGDDAEVSDNVDDGSTQTVESHPYNLRPNRERSYAHRYGHENSHTTRRTTPEEEMQTAFENAESTDDESIGMQFSQFNPDSKSPNTIGVVNYIYHFVFTQMSAKTGIKKHGQAAIDALTKEFLQFDRMDVYEGILVSDLTPEQKKQALRSVSLIKEKRNGLLKGRVCADGRPQRRLFTKADTTSPTISTPGLLLSILIDAHENRDVATADVAGAYLNAIMPDFTVMRIEGPEVDILCKIDPTYHRFVTSERGNKVLYLRLNKALYGCVKSALLWYQLFSTTLKDMGFELNPYDPCVANKMIDGHQCTVAWYVDDNKISHKNPLVVTSIIEKIESKFGKMTVTRGSQHTFLGMEITYNENHTATIYMKPYLREAIEAAGLDSSATATSPAARNLFAIDPASPRLSQSKSDIFHSLVAKLLFVSQRARVDLLLPIAFLCTRVSCSTQQDWRKLLRVLAYANGTIDLPFTLGADDLTRIRSWVDASFAVHPDMKSHTGGVVSFGYGGLLCKSTKHKLNTLSSTEAELVGVSDYLPNIIWVRMFLEAQGYKISANILEQDNESAIRLETNGRASAGPRSRHINIRHFFIKDRVSNKEVSIRHCPTLSMLADFFTKPLQGSLFRKFRDVLLGIAHVSTLVCRPPLLSRSVLEKVVA